MKKILIPLLSILLIFSCTKDGDDNGDSNYKGLVYFSEDPVYLNGYITFTALVQFGTPGKAVPIEYQVWEGDNLISSGDASTTNSDGGLMAFFETGPINVPIDVQSYSGKNITVWLDPDNKVTSDLYTSEDYVELYKKEEVTIP